MEVPKMNRNPHLFKSNFTFRVTPFEYVIFNHSESKIQPKSRLSAQNPNQFS